MAILNEDIIGGRGFGSGGGDFGGGLGLIALLALLGRNGGGGLLGGGGSDIGGLNNINAAVDSAAILGKLGNIEASVPLNSSQLQLAIAQATAALGQQSTAQTFGIMNALSTHALDNCQSFAGVARDIAAVDTNVDRQSCVIQNVVHSEGETTRALIQSIDKANDSRLIVTQANEISELRNEGRRRDDRHGVEITMTNNQNQNQLQFQQQSQEFASLRGLLFEALQSIRSTNQAINIGGTQLASPTNTNSNVKA